MLDEPNIYRCIEHENYLKMALCAIPHYSAKISYFAQPAISSLTDKETLRLSTVRSFKGYEHYYPITPAP